MKKIETKETTVHDEIKRWAEAREGKQAVIKTKERMKEGEGILRINFPGAADANFEVISWEEFFVIFNENKLKFSYQEETEDGAISRFHKFLKHEAISD